MRFYLCCECGAEVAAETVERLVPTRIPDLRDGNPRNEKTGWARLHPGLLECANDGMEMMLVETRAIDRNVQPYRHEPLGEPLSDTAAEIHAEGPPLEQPT